MRWYPGGTTLAGFFLWSMTLHGRWYRETGRFSAGCWCFRDPIPVQSA